MLVDSTLLFAIFEIQAGMLLVVLAIGLAFGLGNFLAKSLQLKDLAGKMTGVLAATFVSMIFFIYPYVRASLQQGDYETCQDEWKEDGKKCGKDVATKSVDWEIR